MQFNESDNMEMTVQIDEVLIQQAVQVAVAQAFRRDQYRSNPADGAGAAAIQRQVDKFVSNLDMSAAIAEAANRHLNHAVETAVIEVLNREAKKRAKAQIEAGRI